MCIRTWRIWPFMWQKPRENEGFGYVGASCSHLAIIFPLVAILGSSWAVLGAILGRLGGILGASWGYPRSLGALKNVVFP